MKKTLIVFYSRTGHTRKLAGILARALDADVDEIRETRRREGLIGFLRSGYEAVRKVRPALLQPRRHPHAYARVVLGTPVWAAHVSSPVRSWIARHSADVRQVAFFCTYGRRGADETFAEMAQLLDHAPLATLKLTERQVHEGAEDRAAPFVKTLLGPA